jgi:glutamate racemase
VLAEIAPCFKEKDGTRTDAIALACTHYPLLLDVYRRVAPWEVIWVDPAPAIARRVVTLLVKDLNQSVKDPIQQMRDLPQESDNKAFFTSDSALSEALSALMMSRGLPVGAGLQLRFS